MNLSIKFFFDESLSFLVTHKCLLLLFIVQQGVKLVNRSPFVVVSHLAVDLSPLLREMAQLVSVSLETAHLARLRTELEKIIGAREMRQKLFLQGWRVDDVGAKALAQRIAQDTATYGDVISRNKIRID